MAPDSRFSGGWCLAPAKAVIQMEPGTICKYMQIGHDAPLFFRLDFKQLLVYNFIHNRKPAF
jgi:hypothetical protein